MKVLAGASFSSRVPGVLSSSRDCDRMQILMVVALKSLFPCWSSARGYCQLLQATHIPCHVAPSVFKTSRGEFFVHQLPLVL